MSASFATENLPEESPRPTLARREVDQAEAIVTFTSSSLANVGGLSRFSVSVSVIDGRSVVGCVVMWAMFALTMCVTLSTMPGTVMVAMYLAPLRFEDFRFYASPAAAMPGLGR